MILGINVVRNRTTFGDDTGIGLLFVGMLALDKAEADFYTQDHARRALDYASLVGRAILDAGDGEQQSYA